MKSEGRSPIIRLVKTASEQKSLEGISEMLRVVSEEMEGWGTLLWMPAPGANIPAGTGRLFVLAYWIARKDIRLWHELPFNSLVGRVLQSRAPIMASMDDPRVATPQPEIIRDSATRYGCLVPMTMADGTDAVLEVYRSEDRPFDLAEIGLLSEMAAIIPALYATLTDRVGFQLTTDISRIWRNAEQDGRKSAYDAALNEITERIAKDFRCLEVSIFLQDEDEPNVCRLKAHKKVWEGPWTGRTEYRKGTGSTGWVFERGRTVRIVNLARYEEDKDWIEHQYPLLAWTNSLRMQDRAAEYFGSNDPDKSPPLSFVCAPLKLGDSIWGAIRCCGSIQNPFYFDGWQAQVLESVGAQIGAWWQDLLRKRSKEAEALAIDRLLNGFHKMNRFVQKNLGRHSWDENAFFKVAMDLALDVIPKTGSSDVRMVEGNELVTKATSGQDWVTLGQTTTKRYRLNPPNSTASYVVKERTGCLVYDDVDNAPYWSRTFTNTRKLILAPIEAGEAIFGVLCIRSSSPAPFPKSARLAAGLLGQQLGLYHSLALQILNLKEAERKNEKMIATQAATIKDVHHQVKSPVIIAYRTAQLLLDDRRLLPIFKGSVERVRGTCGMVLRVVRNMGMFSDLSKGDPLRLKKTLLRREQLLSRLRETCSDHASLSDAQKKVTIHLDEKSFQELAGKDRVGKLVEADWQLVEQCINNLMDNAFKYSFEGSEIRVFGGVQARGSEYFIAVANEGLDVKPEEVQKLKERGYRSEKAIDATGEGSGIGLWIVDQIMSAHGGSLDIAATANGVTLVKLVFSIVKGIENLTDATENLAARR